jgi:hypothetical protein
MSLDSYVGTGLQIFYLDCVGKIEKLHTPETFFVYPPLCNASTCLSWIRGETNFNIFIKMLRGHAVAQLVGALHLKPEGCVFDTRLCHSNFSLTQSLLPHFGPGVESASNRN